MEKFDLSPVHNDNSEEKEIKNMKIKDGVITVTLQQGSDTPKIITVNEGESISIDKNGDVQNDEDQSIKIHETPSQKNETPAIEIAPEIDFNVKKQRVSEGIYSLVEDQLKNSEYPSEITGIGMSQDFTTNSMNSKNRYVTLPRDAYSCVAEVKIARRPDWFDTDYKNFMLNDHDLIPLGTHVEEGDKNSIHVVVFSEDYSSKEGERTIGEYVLSKLPDDIILTRVLSEEESKKYEAGSKDLGSERGDILWGNGEIHTAIHNISSEFINNEKYTKALKFKIKKEILQKLMESSSAEIGTYNWVFVNRDENSPLPFEAEIVFKPEAQQILIDGFNRWRKEDGGSILENPFASTTERY